MNLLGESSCDAVARRARNCDGVGSQHHHQGW